MKSLIEIRCKLLNSILIFSTDDLRGICRGHNKLPNIISLENSDLNSKKKTSAKYFRKLKYEADGFYLIMNRHRMYSI